MSSTEQMGVMRQLPQYQCHKKVWALKIKAVERHTPTIAELEATLNSQSDEDDATGATITPEDEGYAPFTVSVNYWHKHQPQAGGYYVVYSDGYKSYSPAKAFEEGYTLITGGGQ